MFQLNKIYLLLLLFISSFEMTNAQQLYKEPYRGQVHFSPKAHWMNDPNGMVYMDGVYHLFYQYYPDSTVWGPMHWGHATSQDLVHWEHQPIALYPDSLGYIFSGSAVVDHYNTSGFGKDGIAPMVAIFTYHDPVGEKKGTSDFQRQGIAYSQDKGKTWIKYAGNPVLKNPGIRAFRDPKVFWYAPGKKWIMTLATLDCVSFYSSIDLKEWKEESSFGKTAGVHGGVWECPDLFPLEYQGKQVWVLLVNLNPGGPNGGSATQYFIGQFDGHTFTATQEAAQWADYGPDEYAGVTFSNTGSQKILMGWMTNWQYAQVVPTVKWRSALTIPRELGLEKVGDRLYLVSNPVKELGQLVEKRIEVGEVKADLIQLTNQAGGLRKPLMIHFQSLANTTFTLRFSNDKGDQLLAGYDSISNNYFINRTHSGIVDFHQAFAKLLTAPRISRASESPITLLVDESSIELFADSGLTLMTATFFPQERYNDLQLTIEKGKSLHHLVIEQLKSIW